MARMLGIINDADRYGTSDADLEAEYRARFQARVEAITLGVCPGCDYALEKHGPGRFRCWACGLRWGLKGEGPDTTVSMIVSLWPGAIDDEAWRPLET